MKIALVGGKGMLGTDLAEACARQGHDAVVLDLPKVDITAAAGLAEAIPDCDWVVNCAAYTRVDDAEKERELCWKINADGAGHVARACAARGLPLLHVSTDYVFNGLKGTPYLESDPVAPLNYYGESKLGGERAVQAAGARAVLVRTQSLYGLRGRNFVRAILGQIQKGRMSLSVVRDQVSSPTYTRHLAEGLLRLMDAQPPPCIVNVAAAGHCSWWDFACAIVSRVRPGVAVQPLASSELNLPARRPAFSVLDTSLFASLTGAPLPHWREGLEAYLAEEPLARELSS